MRVPGRLNMLLSYRELEYYTNEEEVSIILKNEVPFAAILPGLLKKKGMFGLLKKKGMLVWIKEDYIPAHPTTYLGSTGGEWGGWSRSIIPISKEKAHSMMKGKNITDKSGGNYEAHRVELLKMLNNIKGNK